MKKWKAFVLIAWLALPSCSQGATENRYDVFLKTFTPLLQVFAAQNPAGNHAVAADIRLIELTGLPRELIGTQAHLALEPPDKALLVVRARPAASGTGRVIFSDEEVGFSRQGQEILLTPGSKFQPFIDALGELPRAKKKYQFEPMMLPLPAKQLALVPVLFSIEEEPSSDPGVRRLSLRFMPELAKSIGLEEWTGKVTVGPDYKPLRIEFSRGEFQIAFEVDSVTYAESLPAGTWTFGNPDVLHLKAPRVRQIVEALEVRGRR